jgi:hypothetical protein
VGTVAVNFFCVCGLVKFLNQEKIVNLKDRHLNVQAVTLAFIYRGVSVLFPSWA